MRVLHESLGIEPIDLSDHTDALDLVINFGRLAYDPKTKAMTNLPLLAYSGVFQVSGEFSRANFRSLEPFLLDPNLRRALSLVSDSPVNTRLSEFVFASEERVRLKTYNAVKMLLNQGGVPPHSHLLKAIGTDTETHYICLTDNPIQTKFVLHSGPGESEVHPLFRSGRLSFDSRQLHATTGDDNYWAYIVYETLGEPSP